MASAFLERFPAPVLLEALESDIERRVRLLVEVTGTHKKIAARKSIASATEDLQLALDECTTSPDAIVKLFEADEWLGMLGVNAIWRFLTEDGAWLRQAIGEEGMRRARLVLDRGVSQGLLTEVDVVGALPLGEVTARLTNKQLRAVVTAALSDGRANLPFSAQRLNDVLGHDELLAGVSGELVWHSVIFKRLAPAAADETAKREPVAAKRGARAGLAPAPTSVTPPARLKATGGAPAAAPAAEAAAPAAEAPTPAAEAPTPTAEAATPAAEAATPAAEAATPAAEAATPAAEAATPREVVADGAVAPENSDASPEATSESAVALRPASVDSESNVEAHAARNAQEPVDSSRPPAKPYTPPPPPSAPPPSLKKTPAAPEGEAMVDGNVDDLGEGALEALDAQAPAPGSQRLKPPPPPHQRLRTPPPPPRRVTQQPSADHEAPLDPLVAEACRRLAAIDRLPPGATDMPLVLLRSIESMYNDLSVTADAADQLTIMQDAYPNEALQARAMIALLQLHDPDILSNTPSIEEEGPDSLSVRLLTEERQRSRHPGARDSMMMPRAATPLIEEPPASQGSVRAGAHS